MFETLTRMIARKKSKNSSATIAGALSLGAMSGALITWYTARRMRNRKDNQFLFNQDEENRP